MPIRGKGTYGRFKFCSKNGLVVNGAFTANSTQFGLGSVTSNTTAISIGGNYINSTSFTGTSANSTLFAGQSLSTIQNLISSNAATAYSNSVSYVNSNPLAAANSTNSFGINGNASTSTSAIIASKASTLAQNGAAGSAMTFYWAGQAGQPSYLWGSNDGLNHYVWVPSNFNVNSAISSTNLFGDGIQSNANTYLYTGSFGYTPTTVGSPDGSYGTILSFLNYGIVQDNSTNWLAQFAINTAGTGAYYRVKTNSSAFSAWKTLLDSSNYNSYAPTLTGTGASGNWNINASNITSYTINQNLGTGNSPSFSWLTVYGSISLDPPNPNNFTQFSSLKSNTVQSWVEDKIGNTQLQSYQTTIETDIANQSNPPTVMKDAPWMILPKISAPKIIPGSAHVPIINT
jgi:hypothetical protein